MKNKLIFMSAATILALIIMMFYFNINNNKSLKDNANKNDSLEVLKEDLSIQSKLMLEYTGKSWSKELEAEMRNIDFSQFGFNINNPVMINDVNSLYVLANKANYFPENFKPINLVTHKSEYFGGGNRNRLRKEAADALDSLVYAAEKAGYNIKNVSGYRSIGCQKYLFRKYAAKDGKEKANLYSAKPGCSEHHTGLCADVSSPCMAFMLEEDYGSKKEGIWLAENAHKYGFIIRYPKDKENITGYIYEPWHIRYLGIPLASYLKETQLTYEEFLALQTGKMPDEIKLKNHDVPGKD